MHDNNNLGTRCSIDAENVSAQHVSLIPASRWSAPGAHAKKRATAIARGGCRVQGVGLVEKALKRFPAAAADAERSFPVMAQACAELDIMKTQGLIQALDSNGFDAAFGGARRDEEKSRAKERVFSFRNSAHRWDPKNQRPELWNLYNGRKAMGESIRIFPLSNWTELDIWQYIYRENIPIVPLYFAAERPVIERDGMLMLVDDDRLKLFPGEKIHTKRVRFRTLGCYPLTGAIESDADSLPKIILELMEARTSERQGRAIDTDSSGSMEKKKQEGYF